MRHHLLVTLATFVLLPCAAQAQSAAGALGDPIIIVVPAPHASAPLAPPVQSPGYAPQPIPVAPAPYPLATAAPAPASWQPTPYRGREPRLLRRSGPSFAASFGQAWAGFGIGAGVGALGGTVISGATCNEPGGGLTCLGLSLGVGILSSAVAAPLGAGLSAWAFGDSRGGTGNAFAAIGGAYLGAGMGIGLGYLIAQMGGDAGGWGVILGIIAGAMLTNLGAAAGYQLSSHGSKEPGGASTASLVVPTLGPTSDGRGVSIGVVGTL